MDDSHNRFFHHPELKDLISDPAMSSFRSFDAHAVFTQRPELDWVVNLLHTKSQRDLSRQRALAGRTGSDLWVFAYGSLMWDPAMHFLEVRRAFVPDFARHFILKDIYGGRGTREAPGLMAALDQGDGCDGLAFRIAKDQIESETDILWRREMVGEGYIPTFVTAMIDNEPIEALTFVADRQADSICWDVTRPEQIRYISTGQGFLGTSLEYLENIMRHFDALGIVDEDCAALLADVHTHCNSRNSETTGRQTGMQGLNN